MKATGKPPFALRMVDVGKTGLSNNGAKAIKMINFVLGDGIEKKESDFAAEVAEQMNQANK